MSLYNMPSVAPQPTSSLTSESPLSLAPTVGDHSSPDLYGSGTTNGTGNGPANGHGHGHGHGPGHGSASANGNENGSANGTVTPTSAHDQGSQSAATGPAVPAACLACVSSPFLSVPLLLPSIQCPGLLLPTGDSTQPRAGGGCSLPSCRDRVHNTGLTRTHAVSVITA